MPFFCAVPPTLPPSPEGVRAFPGAGPYYVNDYRLNQQIVIRRNRYYGGNREHHVDGFDVDLSGGSPEEMLDRVDAGKADWGYMLAGDRLRARPTFSSEVRPQLLALLAHAGLDGCDVRPQLLPPALPGQPAAAARRQPRPRQDTVHRQLRRRRRPTSYLPPGVAGFRDRSIYPLERRPGPRAGAGGGKPPRRKGQSSSSRPARGAIACAQFVQGQLAQIGLDVEIQPFGEHGDRVGVPRRLGSRTSPGTWRSSSGRPTSSIPSAYINRLLDDQDAGAAPGPPGSTSPSYTELMRQAARLRGAARARPTPSSTCSSRATPHRSCRLSSCNEATLVSARVDRMRAAAAVARPDHRLPRIARA